MSLRRILSIMLLACLVTLPDEATAGSSLVGTWRSENGSLQLATNHTFLVSLRSSGIQGIFLPPLEMRGEWEEHDGSLRLKAMQARCEGEKAGNFDLNSPFSSMTGSVHVAESGRRSFRLLEEVFQHVSDEAVVPGPWDVSPPPPPESLDMESAWIVRPPVYPYPRLDLICETNAAHQIEMVFAKSKAITGSSGLAVWEEGATNYLWRVKMNGVPLDRLVYGVLPTSSPRHSVKQVQPQSPRSPRLPSQGKRFFVRIDVDYETLIPPSRGSDPMFFVFEFGKDGQIRRIHDVAPRAVKEPGESGSSKNQETGR